MVSDAIVGLFTYLFGFVGISLNPVYVRLGSIFVILLVIWKYSNVVNKVVLFALVFMLMSSVAGLLTLLLSSF